MFAWLKAAQDAVSHLIRQRQRARRLASTKKLRAAKRKARAHDRALAARVGTGNGPPPRVTEGFAEGTTFTLFAVGAALLGYAFWFGDAWVFFGTLALGAYLWWCYHEVHQGKFLLKLFNGGLTGEILEHGGHFVWKPFQKVEEVDSEEANTEVRFKGICADKVEASGELSVPQRPSYDITDSEGHYRAYKIKKSESDERTKAFTLPFVLWLLSGLTTDQYVKHQAGFARAVAHALRYANFPEDLQQKLATLGVAEIEKWPLEIVTYFDKEVGSVFGLVVLPGAPTNAQIQEEARLSYSPLELLNGREVREGVSLTKVDYDKTLKQAQVEREAAKPVAQQFEDLAKKIKKRSPTISDKDLVGATLAAMGKGSFVQYGGLENATTVQIVGAGPK
jgi:hypothetical protein